MISCHTSKSAWRENDDLEEMSFSVSHSKNNNSSLDLSEIDNDKSLESEL